MLPEINIAEKNFQHYLPLLKEVYPQERRDKTAIAKLVKQHENIMILDNVVMGLFDSRKANFLYLSENFQKIAHYKRSTVINWGSLFLFRALHPSHYSYAFNAIRIYNKFYKNLPSTEKEKTSIYIGGLKVIDGHRKTRLAFLKLKVLLWTADGQPDVSILFGEEVTHLMKNGHYWLRYQSTYRNTVYVHQKGKKNFPELVSDSELKVLKLIAEKKTNAEIADGLFLSKATVETHRKNMIKRVGAVNSTALVHLCKMAGIL